MTMALCKTRSRVIDKGNSLIPRAMCGWRGGEEGVFVTSWSGNSRAGISPTYYLYMLHKYMDDVYISEHVHK